MAKGSRKPSGGWFLREWLAERKLKNVDVEHATGFSKAIVSEAITKKPPHWRIQQIAIALKVPPEALSYHPKSSTARAWIAWNNVPADRADSAIAMLQGLGQTRD